MSQLYVQAFSALHSTGMYTSARGHIPWMEEQDTNPLKVKRKQVYEQLHTGFGKLNAPDKLAFSAVALLLADFNEYNGEKTGICLGNAFGSFSTDRRYAESVTAGFPSPALFSATLPSSPVSEVAIMFKLKGPNRVIVGSSTPGLSAMSNAMNILSAKKAAAMLVILVQGLDPEEENSFVINTDITNGNYSYAFMLTPDTCNTGLNYRLALCRDKTDDNNSQKSSEESYFFEILTTLIQNRNFSHSFSTETMKYSLTLQKDS